MSFHVPHPRPIARATGSLRGHRLHIGRPVEGIGYVAICGCHQWGDWYPARRVAVQAFRLNHLGIDRRSAA